MSRNIDSDTKVLSESALVQIDFSPVNTKPDVLRIVEDPFLGLVNLRGSTQTKGFEKAVASVLGLELPVIANATAMNGEVTVIWLGPSEWLTITATDRVSTLVTELQASLADIFSQVTDVTGGFATVDISGTSARSLMKKACTIDLHPREFKTGDSAQTTFAHAGATFYQTDDSPGYRVLFRRSFADYIGHWLIDASQEFLD